MPTSAEVRERKRAVAFRKLVEVTEARVAAETKADKMRKKQFRFILKSYEAGLSYREIGETTGLTEIRIAQILRAERQAS